MHQLTLISKLNYIILVDGHNYSIALFKNPKSPL